MGNLTFEFELCDTNDAIIAPATYDAATGYDAVYTAANTTNKWQIQNARILADIIALDSQLNASYIEYLLSGRGLNIEYSIYISQQSSVVGKSFSVQVIRAVSRLQKHLSPFGQNQQPES